MKLASFVGLVMLFLLLFSTFGQAELVVQKFTNDFAVDSPLDDDVKLCSCETRTDIVAVTNTGNFVSKYNVDVLTEQSWYELSLEEFMLAPGETKEFMLYASPPCGTLGDYQYTIAVASSYGRERFLTRDVTVHHCQNLFFLVGGNPGESGLGQSINFTLILQNVAEFGDNFQLDFGEFNQFIYVEEQWLYLRPGEMRSITAIFTPPYEMEGDITIPFTVMSEKNGLSEQRLEELTLYNQFDHDIIATSGVSFCSRIDSAYTFSIKNTNDVQNTYALDFQGLDFLDRQSEEITLEPFEERELSVPLSPLHGEEGSHSFVITADSERGHISKSKEIAIDVQDCFVSESVFSGLELVEDSYIDVTCCGEKIYALNIHNQGLFEESYSIFVDAPVWFTPHEQQITLQPSENRNLLISAELPCTDEIYEIPVTVVLDRHPELRQKVMLTIDSQTQRTCHAVNLVTEEVNINEEANVIPLIVRNVGIAGGTYTLDALGELFESVREESVTLFPGQEAVIHVMTKENLTEFFDGNYLTHLTLEHELNISYEEEFITEFDHISWFGNLTRFLARYNYGSLPACIWLMFLLFVLLIAILLFIFLLFAGHGTWFRITLFTENGLLITRTVLLLILLFSIIALLVIGGPDKKVFYEPGFETNNLVLQWYQNEEFRLDLSAYFEDPDSDPLFFTSTQPEHMNTYIENGIAIFRPGHNFAGQEQIVFTADDGKGGIVDSPIFSLVVLKRLNLSPSQWLTRWCDQFNLGFIILISISLLALFLFVIPRESEEEYSDEEYEEYVEIQEPTKPVKVAEPTDIVLVASQQGSKAHKPQCTIAQRISKKQLRTFTSKGAATRAGYLPCKSCRAFDEV